MQTGDMSWKRSFGSTFGFFVSLSVNLLNARLGLCFQRKPLERRLQLKRNCICLSSCWKPKYEHADCLKQICGEKKDAYVSSSTFFIRYLFIILQARERWKDRILLNYTIIQKVSSVDPEIVNWWLTDFFIWSSSDGQLVLKKKYCLSHPCTLHKLPFQIVALTTLHCCWTKFYITIKNDLTIWTSQGDGFTVV